MATIAERVQAGIEWLDAKEPAWFDKIDLYKFHISNCEVCVLGQLYGHYRKYTSANALKDKDMAELGMYPKFSHEEPQITDEYANYSEENVLLTNEWKRRILEKRQGKSFRKVNFREFL